MILYFYYLKSTTLNAHKKKKSKTLNFIFFNQLSNSKNGKMIEEDADDI
jgi:hypothetical protein